MIKVIGFDFGDVLIKDTLKALEIKYWSRKVPPAAKQKFIRTIHKVDTGKEGEKFLIKTLHETLTPHLSEGQIKKYLFNTKLLPPWRLLLKVSRHYPIAILTNNYRQGPETFAKLLKINLSPYRIINSSHLGVRKPHADYYRLALRRLALKPEELLFIDDVPANVAGARNAGIKSFRYNKNMPQLRAFLKKNGIKGL
jgi:HAD superfamily hydrolase (TIGR01509 family)